MHAPGFACALALILACCKADSLVAIDAGPEDSATQSPARDANASVTDATAPGPAYAVTARLTWQGTDSTPSLWPSSVDFVLFRNDTSQRLAAGAGGAASVAPFTIVSGRLRAGGRLVVAGAYNAACELFTPSFSFESMEIGFAGSQLNGTASGTATVLNRDVTVSRGFVADLMGTPDTRGPTLPMRDAWHPMDPIDVTLDEPLPAGTTLTLRHGSLETALPAATSAVEPVAHFKLASVALSSGPASLTFRPAFVDLAGNPGEPRAAMIVVADVTAMITAGFETGDPTAGTGMEIATTRPPALVGKRSLYSPPGPTTQGGRAPRLTARLAVPTGATKVTARVRMAAARGYQTVATTIHTLSLGVPGRTITQVDLPAAPADWTEDPASATLFGPVTTISVNLPSGAPSEVIVDIAPRVRCGVPVPPFTGFLLDDLRAE